MWCFSSIIPIEITKIFLQSNSLHRNTKRSLCCGLSNRYVVKCSLKLKFGTWSTNAYEENKISEPCLWQYKGVHTLKERFQCHSRQKAFTISKCSSSRFSRYLSFKWHLTLLAALIRSCCLYHCVVRCKYFTVSEATAAFIRVCIHLEEDSRCIRNVTKLLPYCMASHSRRHNLL